jgi:hypothetical protein
LAAKTAFGDFFFKWAGPFLKKMEEKISRKCGELYLVFETYSYLSLLANQSVSGLFPDV